MEAAVKESLIAQLRNQVWMREGFRSMPDGQVPDLGLGPVDAAFPNGVFPLGAVHEFISPDGGSAAATNGFIAGLLGKLVQREGFCLWVSARRTLFPPGLSGYGIQPDRIIFVDLHREQDVLWVVEQGLACNALSAVVGELDEVSFAASRRLQLAVEQSRVTGFLHRYRPRTRHPLACVSRWRIRPLASVLPEALPGVGYPRWEVELVRIRNGRPGIWQLEWQDGIFRPVPEESRMVVVKARKYA